MEVGTVDILLTEDGENNKLLGVLPKIFKGHEANYQSVLQRNIWSLTKKKEWIYEK